MARLQLLGNESIMASVRQSFPELAHAAEHDPQKFAELLPRISSMQDDAARQKQRNAALLSAFYI